MIEFRRFPVIAMDLETTGLRAHIDTIIGVALSTPDGESYYFDTREHDGVLNYLREELPRCPKVAFHNAKFDIGFLHYKGIHLRPEQTECTMVRAALLNEHELQYSLDYLAQKYVGFGKEEPWEELAALFGGKPTKAAQIGNLARAPTRIVAKYARGDTQATLALYQYQQGILEAQGLMSVLGMEMKLLHTLSRMELGGVRVDVAAAEEAIDRIDKLAIGKQADLNALAGFEINPNPSNSIKELFKPEQIGNHDKEGDPKIWKVIDGTLIGSTDAGAPSLDAAALRTIKHPAAAMILDLRKLLKCRDTFLKGHVLGSQHNEYAHTNFSQTKSEAGGTGTGRLASSSPALQQIPARDKEIALIVRSLFLPDPGHTFAAYDWAQMDFRVMAHYVQDPDILASYITDRMTDFHQKVADMTGLPRSPRFGGDANAKQINLGLSFGMGRGKLAQEMGLPYTVELGFKGKPYLKPGPEAEAIFEQYHSAIPGISRMTRDASNIAKSRGYVKSILGRHINFPGGNFVHKAAGLIFQGTAADCLKQKLVEVDEYLRSVNNGSRLLLSVHDEFDVSIPEGDTKTLAGVHQILEDFGPESVIPLRVPVVADCGTGPNWYEASK